MGNRVWWAGATGYLGGDTGIEWKRHDFLCRPGFWRVGITGWALYRDAVVDDFGTLIGVQQ